MASVRLTNELKDIIINNANKAFTLANPEISPSTELQQVLRTAISNAPLQTYMKAFVEGASSINHKGSFSISSILPKLRDITSVTLETELTTTNIALDVPLKIYEKDSYYPNTRINFTDLPQEYQSEVSEKVSKYRHLKNERSEKETAYMHSIRDLVHKCTTLKQLLQAWPAIESFVPQEYLQKLHQKVTRAQKIATIKEEVVFNDSLANQVALTAKLLGS